MLRRFKLGRRPILALLSLLVVAGCDDDLPTLTGGDRFPGGTRPATFEVIVPAEGFVRTLGQFSGFTGPRDADFLLVANRFDGALEAHTLARFGAFPETVTFSRGGTQRTDSIFTLVSGSLVAPVDTAASAAEGAFRVQVWALAQEWDLGTVTWELAVDTAGVRVPWRTPGGTKGALLAESEFATVQALGDTVRIPLDTATLRQVTEEGFPGILVTAAGAAGRIQLGRAVVRAEVRPESAQDTTVRITAGAGSQTFIFTPEPPASPAAWEAAGIRSARTLFEVDLGLRVPVCPQAGCAKVPLREVTLNEVSLLLEPVPVPAGFRPLAPVPLLVRRVVEPELGRRAPLGEVVNDPLAVNPATGQTVAAGGFFTPGESPFVIPITAFASRLAAEESQIVSLALLGEGGAARVATFGIARFAPNPRLRIVYTVPVRPRLP